MNAPLSEPTGASCATRRRLRAEVDGARRAPALIAVALVLAGVVVAGATVSRRPDPGVTAGGGAAGPAALAPVAPAADALGSTWYCAAGTGTDAGPADHYVTIASLGDRAVEVVLTVVPGAAAGETSTARPVIDTLEVPARGRLTIRLGDLVDSPFVAAVVEAGRGEVVVEHSVNSSTDVDVAPCASSSSAQWYLAAGTTTRDASELLVLFNPFPDDAVVDISFTTPDGLRAPPAFAGFIVPGQRVVAIDVGSVVSRHPNVATEVVARSGRLVVERLQSFDGTDGPAGLAVTAAAPAPSAVWTFPDGLVGEGIAEVITVYNPGTATAAVDVEIDLDPSADPGAPLGADPFAISVPPKAYVQVDVRADGRVPDARGHSVTVRSQTGVPVVAEQWVRSGAPAPRTGLAATLGSPILATRWLSANGGATAELAAYLVLVNPSLDAIATVSITAPTPSQELAIPGLEAVEVPEGGRVLLDLGEYLNRPELLLIIESNLPIVAERALYVTTGGFTQSILVASGPASSVPLAP